MISDLVLNSTRMNENISAILLVIHNLLSNNVYVDNNKFPSLTSQIYNLLL